MGLLSWISMIKEKVKMPSVIWMVRMDGAWGLHRVEEKNTTSGTSSRETNLECFECWES